MTTGTTDLKGLLNQICWLGGCLLITYVPCGPNDKVNTPDYPPCRSKGHEVNQANHQLSISLRRIVFDTNGRYLWI